MAKQKIPTDPFSAQPIELGEFQQMSPWRDWTEEMFLKKGLKREALGKNFNKKKVYIIGNILLFFILLIALRSAWLQIIKGDYYYGLAQGNRIKTERIEAKRGIIYDRDYNPLVNNVANFLLYFIPYQLPIEEKEQNKILEQISRILDKPPDELKNILAKVKKGSLESFKPLFIADNIPYEKALAIYLKLEKWPGAHLSNKTRRQYRIDDFESRVGDKLNSSQPQDPQKIEPTINTLSHILGYTGKINQTELEKFGDEYLPIDYIGKVGIEYFWEAELKGKGGKKKIEVDALGREKKIISEEKAEDGRNLALSIDIILQKKIEQILQSRLKNIKSKRAVVIVMNPNNGEIIALVNNPTYDNNVFARGIKINEYQKLLNNKDKPLFNRAISGEYPTGSTFKPIMAASALEEGIITEHTSFLSTGGIKIKQWFFPDWKSGGHGAADVRRSLAESVNTFFYYIGGGHNDFEGLGVKRITKYAKLFGLGSQLGIDLAGEASGFLPSKEWKKTTKNERWYIGDTYHLAIGQGDILATPLQVAAFTSVFANGGKLYRPHIVKEILTSDNQKLEKIEVSPIRENFIDPYNIKVVRQGLRQAVTAGSAIRLFYLPVKAAGKTGTAQWSSKKENHAWFTGFAPYEKSEIVVTVLVEESGEGSAIAVPIAKDIFEWYFR